MSMQPYRVGISGSYGGLNLGDEAILESIVRQLRASVPAEIKVFTRDVDDTLRRHDVDRAWDIQGELRRKIKERLGQLQERARTTNRIVVRVLSEARAAAAASAGV